MSFWATDISEPDTGILLYGGCFDPFHDGHAAVVKWLTHNVRGNIWIVPTFEAAYKSETTHHSHEDRMKSIMTRYADQSGISVLAIDKEKNCHGRTENLLESIRSFDARPVAVVVGEDEWSILDQWKNIQTWFERVDWIIMQRPQDPNISLPAHPETESKHAHTDPDIFVHTNTIHIPQGLLYKHRNWILKANNPPIAISGTRIRNQST